MESSSTTLFSWDDFLKDENLAPADISTFPHACLEERLGSLLVQPGALLEVEAEGGSGCWLAWVSLVYGSLLRLRYVTSEEAPPAHFWCDCRGGRLHARGWSEASGVPLVPPPGLPTSAEAVAAALTEAQPAQLPSRRGPAQLEAVVEGAKLELLDEAHPCRVWTATVLGRVGGRLRLRRDTLQEKETELWLSAASPRLRHFGWAAEAGEPFEYLPPTDAASLRTADEWRAIREMCRDEGRAAALDSTILPPVEPPLPPQHSLAVGCRLEAVHPNRTAVCPATVVALLDSYFFRVQIDGSDVCFTSSLQDSSILPHGWCSEHGVELGSGVPSPDSAASISQDAVPQRPDDANIWNAMALVCEGRPMNDQAGAAEQQDSKAAWHETPAGPQALLTDTQDSLVGTQERQPGAATMVPSGEDNICDREAAVPQKLCAAQLPVRPPAELVGLPALSALEVVHPQRPDAVCAARVSRSTDHLLWIRLLSLPGERDLVYACDSELLLPVGWAARHGATLVPPRRWKPLPRRSSSDCETVEEVSFGGAPAESEPTSGSVQLYLHPSCYCGPLLSRGLLAAQPQRLGPAAARMVARQLLRLLVSCGSQASRVLRQLQLVGPPPAGATAELLKVKVQRTIYGAVVELPSRRERLVPFCAAVSARLQCCPGLISEHQRAVPSCPFRCGGAAAPAAPAVAPPTRVFGDAEESRVKPRPPQYLQQAATKRRRPEYLRPSRHRGGRRRDRYHPDGDGTPALYQVSVDKNPRLWDAERLESYLNNTECYHLAETLRQQEVDGVAFMLMTQSALTEVLELSRRDAAALCAHAARLKYTCFTVFSG